jgi:hypothetical protein
MQQQQQSAQAEQAALRIKLEQQSDDAVQATAKAQSLQADLTAAAAACDATTAALRSEQAADRQQIEALKMQLAAERQLALQQRRERQQADDARQEELTALKRDIRHRKKHTATEHSLKKLEAIDGVGLRTLKKLHDVSFGRGDSVIVSKKELHQLHKQAAQQPASVFKPTLAKGSNAFSAEAMLDNAEFINVSNCTSQRVEDTRRAAVRAALRPNIATQAPNPRQRRPAHPGCMLRSCTASCASWRHRGTSPSTAASSCTSTSPKRRASTC